MKKNLLLFILAFIGITAASAQGTVSTVPATLNANEQGKIIFEAAPSSPLYNYSGDVYVHIGVVDGSTWNYVPADWDENIEKCRMTREGSAKWSITLSPTIREWFGATTPVKKIGVVFRNEDGTKKGIAADRFINVVDNNLYVDITVTPESEILPVGSNITVKVTATETANITLNVTYPGGNKDTFTSDGAATSMTTPSLTLSSAGTLALSAEVTANGETARSEKTITVREEVTHATRPAGVTEGINIIDDHTATFVLFDSDKNGKASDCVYWIGDLNQWKPQNEYMMKRDDSNKCWWITINNLDPSVEYAFQYYVVTSEGTTVRLADPYSTKILDPWNDQYIDESVYPGLREYPAEYTSDPVTVFSTKPYKYDWEVTDFTVENCDNLVIYELLIRDFTEEGTIKAATQRLNYLLSLGVNAIELMPVQEFDGNISWGYNPSFFFALDKAYGTEEDYCRFIDECHKRGIAVFLDVVYNHATGNHPYCKLWWNSTTSKPTANNPWFNVDAPHPYSVFNDFNHECPEVRNYIKRNLQYLLTEYKVDGFRFDLTKGFTQQSSNESTSSNYDASRIAILKDYNSAIKAVRPDACMICEHFCAENEEKELAQNGIMLWRKLNNAYCQTAMGYQESSSFTDLYADNNRMPYNSLVGFMESHDEERTQYKALTYGISSIANNIETRMSQAICNAAMFLTVPGPKMIWQFGELGYDISGGNGDTDPKEPHWEYYDDPARHSLYTAYSKLNTLRNSYPELFATNASFSWNASQNDWSGGRYVYLGTPSGDKHVVVAANFTEYESTLTLNFAHTGTWNELLSGSQLNITNTTYRLSVPAHSCVVYTDFTVSGIEDITVDKTPLSIYPNPATDYVYVGENGKLTVMNLAGATLAETYGNCIEVSELPQGIYLLKMESNGKSQVAKFIKQ